MYTTTYYNDADQERAQPTDTVLTEWTVKQAKPRPLDVKPKPKKKKLADVTH